MADDAPVLWVADVARAASERGYGIMVLEPGRVVLTRLGPDDTEVTIESVFLSGDHLRRILAPRDPSDG